MTAAKERPPLTNVDTFRASWPIDDFDQTQAELIHDAERDMPDLLFDAGAVIVGDVWWRITEAWKAGYPYGDPSALVLLLTAPAIPWTDTTRPPRGRPRTVAA